MSFLEYSYHQKESASTVAMGADLKEDILTSDLLNSPRAGVSALSLALDRVKSGSASNVLITASDCRSVPGGSEFEQSYGDGAAAVLVGSDNLIARLEAEYSISATGEKFQLPTPEDYSKEFERLKKVVAEQRVLGREIVVVMGLGFVGAVMAAVVANTQNEKGYPSRFVIGMQRPSTRSYWKIPLLNRGLSPREA
jgi:3-oxoacyl-[acyl-carrier-protein] synthase III